MNFQRFSEQLATAGEKSLQLQLPTGGSVAPHFHVTEVGKVTKEFVDCGGVQRSEQTCVLQTLVANDVDHRLKANKLAKILEMTNHLNLPSDISVEFEVQGDTVQIFSLDACQIEDAQLTLTLAAKQTACLAPDKCGIGDALPTMNSSGCGDTGCC
ncbi:MAG: DUF6428 family protein [Planctomycetota bacterium]